MQYIIQYAKQHVEEDPYSSINKMHTLWWGLNFGGESHLHHLKIAPLPVNSSSMVLINFRNLLLNPTNSKMRSMRVSGLLAQANPPL